MLTCRAVMVSPGLSHDASERRITHSTGRTWSRHQTLPRLRTSARCLVTFRYGHVASHEGPSSIVSLLGERTGSDSVEQCRGPRRGSTCFFLSSRYMFVDHHDSADAASSPPPVSRMAVSCVARYRTPPMICRTGCGITTHRITSRGSQRQCLGCQCGEMLDFCVSRPARRCPSI